MRIDVPTEGIEELIASLGFDDAKNVLTGRAVNLVMDSIETEMQRYAERREARQKNRIVGSPASANNLQRPAEPPPPQPELNYFAPKKNLQKLLQEEWFARVCTRESEYNNVWTDSFVATLMDSEHGEYLARKWGNKNQRLMIKGHVVGLLREAGVIKGSNLAIARAYLGVSAKSRDKDNIREVTTFAKYMGNGKCEPYADWVVEYISKHQEEEK